MSSANVDKANQVRPPIALYVLPTTAAVDVFFIPGVPMDITGQAPQGAHTMLVNFISVQATGSDCYIRFFASAGQPATPQLPGGPGFIVPGSASTLPGPNPAPDPEGGLLIPAGETVRYDLSQLFQRGAPTARVPVQYLSFTSPGGGEIRIWRSSGR